MTVRCFRPSTVAILFSLLLPGFATLPRVQAQSSGSPLGAAGAVWGGEHVRLEVTPEGAMLEFDCASGMIAKPVQMNADGKFNVTGTFTGERPGPVMRDGPTPTPSTYSGSIQGSTMNLTITGRQGESLGDYVLVRGQPGRVVRCK